VPRDTAPKSGDRQMGHHLRKHECTLMHGSLWRISAKSSKSARQHSNRNQSKSSVPRSNSSTYNRFLQKRWDTSELKSYSLIGAGVST
jgi:hypothetical protein